MTGKSIEAGKIRHSGWVKANALCRRAEKRAMVMEPMKPATKPAEKKTVMVEPVNVAPSRPVNDEPAGVARVVLEPAPAVGPTPTPVGYVPAALPSQPSLMVAEPISVRPAIPARR